MHRNKFLYCILVSAFVLSGCSSKPKNVSNTSAPPAPPAVVDKTPAKAVNSSPVASAAAKTDGPPLSDVDIDNIPDAVPKAEPLSRYGNSATYSVNGRTYHVLASAKGYDKTGIGSWYGLKFHGLPTSTRERYDLAGMTAASTELPLPTYVRVTNLKNGKQVIVKVNDRGPFEKNRVIDLSYAAAKKLGYIDEGTALVRVEAIDPSEDKNKVKAEDQPVKHEPRIYMQIGAFSEKNNAYALQQQAMALTNKPVRVTYEEVNEKKIYRVQIGPLASVEENDKLEEKLRSKNLGKPITVIE